MPSRWLLVAASIFALSGSPATGFAAEPATATASGLDLAGRNLAVAPGDDFFGYANGGWDKVTTIPADRASDGAFNKLAELTDHRVADLIQDAARAGPPAGSEARKIADYYRAYMDEATIEARGVAPLKPYLAAYAAIRTRRQLATALGRTLRADVDVLNNTNYYTPNLLGLWVAADLDQPTRYSATLLVGGLGMPSRTIIWRMRRGWTRSARATSPISPGC